MVELDGFQIERILRSGGMSVVYRAIARDGRRVALKLLSAEVCTPSARSRFEREAAAVRALEHPNVVRVVGFGRTPPGGLYLAMELLEGEDLAQRLWRGPLPALEAARVGRAIADALTAAHAAGIVHRDVKPGNVFLCRDGQVKLLDFGLALVAATTRLTVEGSAPGTPSYMAPEQASGERDLDARTDVWGLGATLYHAVVGRVPFEAPSPIAQLVRIQHAELSPLPAHVPRWLQEVVTRALRKDRALRWQSAGALGQALAAGAAAPEVAAADEPPDVLDEPTLDDPRVLVGGAGVLRPLVGREPELGALRSAFALVREEPQATGLLVIGLAGIGKSRLCRELVAEASGLVDAPRPLVLEARAEPERTLRPWGVIEVALSRWIQAAGDRGLLAPGGSQASPELSLLRGEAGTGAALTAAPAVGAQVRPGRAVLALGDLFDELTRHAPVLLFVEDLQWADAATLELLETLPRRLERRPLFVLCTARADPVGVFAEYRRIRLAGLSRGATRQLVSSILTGRAAAEGATLAHAIHGRSGGNPFFAEELALAVRQGRSELPDSIEAAVESRVAGLPAGDQKVLRTAAVLGAVFSADALRALCDGDPTVALERLRREELLVSEPSGRREGERTLSFRHVVVQEVLASLLDEETRLALHRQAAAWAAARPQVVALDVARHLQAAGAVGAAAPHWRWAAEAAFQEGDAAAVLEASEHALRDPSGASGFRLRAMRVDVLSWLGRRTDERAEIDQLEPLARTPQERGTVAIARARSLRLEGRYAEALAAIERGLAERPDDAAARIERSLIHSALGQAPAAVAEASRAVEATRALGDALTRGRALSALALGQTLGGDLAAAAQLYDRARAAYEEAGDTRRAAGARVDVAYAWMVTGRTAEAARVLEDVRETCRAVGDRSDEAYALQNLGLCRARNGEVARGLAAEAEALATARDLGEPRLELGCLLYRATILAESGQAADALGALDEALARHPDRRGNVDAELRALRASVLVALGRREQARDEAAAVLARRASGDGPTEHEATVFLAAHEAGIAGALAEGVAALVERARRISDRSAQEGFLRASPSHLRLLAAARAAGLVTSPLP